MTDIDIHPIGDDRLDEAAEVACRAFGGPAGDEERRCFRSGFDVTRALGAFAGRRLVGTSSSLALELTLPGGSVCRAGGVAWVTSSADHRGQGICRRLMQKQIALMREQGEAVSVLTASAGALYRRFGYGPAVMLTDFRVRCDRGMLRDGLSHSGCSWVRLVDGEEARSVLPGLYERLRRSQPGSLSRPAQWWEVYLNDQPHFFSGHTGGAPLFHAVARGRADEDVGYVSYRLPAEWVNGQPRQSLEIVELSATDPAAYVDLWSHCLESRDVEQVRWSRGRADEPLRWLLSDPRRFEVGAETDHLWLSLLDVGTALSARGYAETGEVVLEVNGPSDGPVGAGGPRAGRCYRLEVEQAGRGAANCAHVDKRADLALDLADLASVYLGGVRFATLAAAGRVRELTSGACRQADRLFGNAAAPHCTTKF